MKYYDPNLNEYVNAVGVKVTFREQADGGGASTFLSTDYTDINGRYSLLATNSDVADPGSGLDVRCTIETVGVNCAVFDPDDLSYIWFTNTLWDLQDGTTNTLDTIKATSVDFRGRAMYIFQTMKKGLNKLSSNGHAPAFIECNYPWEKNSWGTYSDQNMHIKYEYFSINDAILHEYAHGAMYYAYGGYWPENAGGVHTINLLSTIEMAWTEGFAYFFPLTVEEDGWFDYYGGSAFPLETPDIALGVEDGDKCEGRVAAALLDIYDNTPSEGSVYWSEDFCAGLNEIWDIIWDVNIDSLAEFWDVWSSRGYDTHNAVQTLYHNTINYNHPPSFGGLPDKTLEINSTLLNAFNLNTYASDIESSDDSLQFSIRSNSNTNCGVSIDSDHFIDIIPTPNWVGYSDVRVEVHDGIIAKTDLFRITVTPPPSCPYVYTWDGSQWNKDNNLLPFSQSVSGDTGQQDVEDWYLLNQPLLEDNGKYKLQLREYESEHSLFDRVQLLAVDHDPDVRIGVTNDNNIRASRTLHLPAISSDSKKLSIFSNLPVSGSISKTAVLRFDEVLSDHPMVLYISGTPESINRYEVSAPPPPEPKGMSILVKELGADGVTLGAVGMRENRFDAAMLIPAQSISDKGIELEWMNGFRLEDLVLGQLDEKEELVEINELLPEIVTRFDSKAIATTDLAEVDKIYAELSPDETIELTFPASPIPEGKVRQFVLVVTGRYTSENEGTIQVSDGWNLPEIFAISQCYPNPFNSTVTVKYQLPEPSDLSINVYSITGQKVTTLVDGNVQAGYHNVTWQAEGIASGVYLITMNAGNFNQTRRVVFVK